MWTPTTRQQHSRTVTRYQSDLTGAEWRVIAPHLPKPCATGQPAARVADARDRQRHLLCHAGGCPWRLLPNDLPPWGTIYRWFAAWRDDGCFERINHALVMMSRVPFIQRVFANSGYGRSGPPPSRSWISPDAVRTWQIANGSGATPALPQQSSTARAPRPPRPAAHAVTMLQEPR